MLTKIQDTFLPLVRLGIGASEAVPALERDFGFVPKITLREGLRKFAQWYKEYYGA